jgi:hypothetical protein
VKKPTSGGRIDAMVPDSREQKLVSWAANIINQLRRQVTSLREALNERTSQHEESNTAIRQWNTDITGYEDVPIKSGTHIRFYIPHPLFPEERVALEVWVETSAATLRRRDKLYITSESGTLSILPHASNCIYLGLEKE